MAANDTCDIGPKIRLSKVVRNQLSVRIGHVVSLRFSDPNPRSSLTDDTTKVSEFLKNVQDELLFEIFLRLPDCRSAVQYSSVCKHWSSIISNPVFIRNFIHIHDHCRPFSDEYYGSRPFTLLFRRYRHRFDTDGKKDSQYFEPFCQVFSEKSKALHGKTPSGYLSFLPCPVAMIASCDDLVVATSVKHALGIGATENYVCNPLTNQWIVLPRVAPPIRFCGYGLVRESISCSKQLECIADARYRVVLIGRATSLSYMFRGAYRCRCNEFVAVVFCSETGQWSGSIISFPQHWFVENSQPFIKVVSSNGVLYWLEGTPLKGIVAFDPFKDVYTKQCRFIGLPIEGFENGERSTIEGKVHLGVVKGQLRLSQLYKVDTYFVFKVWELKNQDSEFPSWVLVHNLKLKSSKRKVIMLAFDPNNINIVFLLCGKNLCRYDIVEKKYEKIGEYPDEIYDPDRQILTLTLTYPSWPTQIMELPSS